METPIPKNNPYEILWVYCDESFTNVPSSDNRERRKYANLSDEYLATLLEGKPNPLIVAEAARRLKSKREDYGNPDRTE